ncbi:MAG: enoyl-CoA hydratase/isomerase family protein [Acidimicrobiia bacterium]
MHLHIETSGSVATLLIDRPDRHNAFSDEMWSALPGLLTRVEQDRSIRVLVVASSTARVFSAGADVAELRLALEDPDGAERGLRHIRTAFQALIDLPIPTVAAIRGACHGGGVGLAVCCDIRIADTSATFSIPPARLGLLYPFPALNRLVWMLGPGQAKRLLFSARPFDADQAAQFGFVDELHQPDHFETALERLVSEVAANSPLSVRSMKRAVSLIEQAAPDGESLVRALELEALASADHAEGVAAFLGKRLPVFGQTVVDTTELSPPTSVGQ